MAEGSGSRLRDVDGHEYVEYLLGLGPRTLGHRHPAVTGAVASAVSELGTGTASARAARHGLRDQPRTYQSSLEGKGTTTAGPLGSP